MKRTEAEIETQQEYYLKLFDQTRENFSPTQKIIDLKIMDLFLEAREKMATKLEQMRQLLKTLDPQPGYKISGGTSYFIIPPDIRQKEWFCQFAKRESLAAALWVFGDHFGYKSFIVDGSNKIIAAEPDSLILETETFADDLPSKAVYQLPGNHPAVLLAKLVRDIIGEATHMKGVQPNLIYLLLAEGTGERIDNIAKIDLKTYF